MPSIGSALHIVLEGLRVLSLGDAAGGLVPFKLAANPDTGADFRDDAGNLLAFDQAKAKEYYEAAKAELGVDQISIKLMYSSDQGDPEIVTATRIQAQLEEVGFTVTLNSVPRNLIRLIQLLQTVQSVSLISTATT